MSLIWKINFDSSQSFDFSFKNQNQFEGKVEED
jgi:hypothetical protein